MSEPSWWAECRERFMAGESKADLARHFGVTRPSVQRAINRRQPRALGHNQRIATAMRRAWSNPEWAAEQRRKISLGLLNSERRVGRPPKQARWDEPDPARPVFDPAKDQKPDWLRRGR